MANLTGQELAKELSAYLNTFGRDHKEFIDTVLRDHPTMQQATIRLFLETIKAFSEKNYFDGRNESAVKICKEITAAFGDNFRLPLI